MHAAKAAIDHMRLVGERMLVIESEELLRNIDVGVALGGDRPEQVQSAAELLVEDGARQVVSMLRVAVQKEPAAELVLRLIDRDVRAEHVGVADEQRRRRQSRKSAANNMRLHPPLRPHPRSPRQSAPRLKRQGIWPRKLSTMRLAQSEQ